MRREIYSIRILIVVFALLFGAVSGAWALTIDDIEIGEVKPSASAGTISKSISGRVVTLTVTPASGYYIKASDIVVEKLVNTGNVKALGAGFSGITDPIVGHLYKSGTTTEIGSVEYGSSAEYVFTVPDDYAGAYVTATFHLLTEGDVIRITANTNLGDAPDMDKHYVLVDDVSASVVNKLYSDTPFTGIFEGEAKADGSLPKITGLKHALFQTVNGGTVKNVMLDNVDIPSGTNVGAICNEATGDSRIYNCGVLGGSVSGSDNVGGLVGLLNGTARVINCFSYANIADGTNKGGIVGNNGVTSTQTSLTTMVMNCMFYGDISSGGSVSPIYGGTEINNVAGGLNNYNYYRYNSSYSKNKQITLYNRALAMEEKFINRYERYRLLLNSNKKLAAKYASTDAVTVTPDDMMKWVLETADRSISGRDPYPYPILKAQGYYPSIINLDIANAPDSAIVGRNNGGKLPSPRRVLYVNISGSKTSGGQDRPSGARVTRPTLTLERTDKDTTRFNFNYDKVQLPYYNEVGEGNYTENRVVTGWKITSITGGTAGDYHAGDEWGAYNFADRNCTNKDLYSVTGRVFSQGAYFDVPYGVTAITIEPYWGKAAYVSDDKYDVIYNKDYATQKFTLFGNQYTNEQDVDLYGDGNTQKVYTDIAKARTALSIESGKTVYDYAVVLIGNVHQNADPTNNNTPYTVMSIDLDHDNEPDCSYIFGHDNRKAISPIRYDFLNIVGIAEAQMPKEASLFRNVSIFNPLGWFEITNTCVVNFSQFEYDNTARNAKSAAPLILLGGTFQQFVSTQSSTLDYTNKKTLYIHVGSNVWFAIFGNGTHSDGNKFTPHIPISVTGGDYDEFYLSGTYQPNIDNMQSDNAECYISGGRFGEVAGASLEAIWGDVRWDINWADITNFYGGGVNAVNPITGDIRIDMTNSYVNRYCGGPKFGDMTDEKNVTTKATDCVFGTYFGAGFGGNAYNRVKYRDEENKEPAEFQTLYEGDRGKYYDGSTTNAYSAKPAYGKKGKGVATDFDSEFFIWSTGKTGARFYVKFISFSLATTKNVSSTLNKCVIKNNFYGGGSLGKVDGTASSVLNDCTVEGDVFGGGFSASIPTVPVRKTPAFIQGKEPSKNANIGMFEEGEINTTEEYLWKQVPQMPSNGDPGMESGEAGNFVYTDADLTTLGQVGATNLQIKGTTTVAGSVYGGGEESGVAGNTEVNVTNGTIGTPGEGGVRYGNVFGGGKGKMKDKVAGLVKGNTTVNISGSPVILHNIYGGGAYGSVGDFTYDGDTGMPTGLKPETTGGNTTVTITGGTIGTNGHENGMVFGSSRGDVAIPEGVGDEPKVDPNDRMAWVYSTNVTIGTSESESGPAIKGSVYGSGENGHTFQNTQLNILSGKIGVTEDLDIDPADQKGAKYPYRGNVYGGGCGTDMYDSDNDGINDKYNPLAGIVKGTATVNISGGHVVHNVYGAGAMGSVGGGAEANSGKTTINVTGGRIGYDGDGNGHVFGAARGEFGVSIAGSNLANVRETEVNINYPTTPAADNNEKTEKLIAGSVFGGGEAGTVEENVTVKMTGGLVLNDVYGGGALADTQTSNWDATANENAGGWTDADKKSALHTTLVRLTGGNIFGEAYGGGLGESGKPAYVWGDALLDLNGTTLSVETETGTPIADNARGCAVGQVFGCNNAAGSPKGTVTVHVYATQNKDKSQIANTEGDTPVTDAKTKGSYDVKAVYGGGNLAAYEPAGGKETTNSTNVIIDGCGLTSIQQVYGGGNAASTPATEVTVNGTFEIHELFGGGNGKDDLPNGDPNPGANVGFYTYADDAANAQTPEDRATNYGYGSGKASVNVFGGTIHRVFGGSNTKGNVRLTTVTLLDENSGCEFCVDEAYGGGKSAPMDAEARLHMACIPGLQAAYGGAEAAAIQGNVTLNITNGTFDRVFGGNNMSGTINGSITVNIEEIGCKPVKIGELYGGGNQAGYSVYGYNADGTPKDSGTKLYEDPQVNVMSFTSIGKIFGGGYGSGATMVGNPTVNVNGVYGKWYDDEASVVAEDAKTPGNYPIPSHAKGNMGAINEIFGGGNAAKVIGNTSVNIATLSEVYVEKQVTAGEELPEGCYTRSGAGTTASPYVYTDASGIASADVTYYEKKDVLGADIRGNVYGGGNNAEVTGSSNVVIGR